MPTVAEVKMKCTLTHEDGAGVYCKAIDINALKSAGRLENLYPHKYLRTDCYGSYSLCPFKMLFKGGK